MAYIGFEKLWRGEFHNNVSAKDTEQDTDFNQLKLKVNDTYKEDEKITRNFVASDDSDVINKAYLDEIISKIVGQVSFIEKDYNEVNTHNN